MNRIDPVEQENVCPARGADYAEMSRYDQTAIEQRSSLVLRARARPLPIRTLEPFVTPPPDAHAPSRRLLITAGPTHEPIDAVRFIGNRSSGRLGVSLAESAVRQSWHVRLLLGPTCVNAEDSRVEVVRFRTCADLEAALATHAPWCDVLVMAAAVADYRPATTPEMLAGKRRRTGDKMVLELEPTPDLLAGVSRNRRPDQTFVGFALEPRAEMLDSARSKLARKSLDMIVANPLETMDAPTIEATVLTSDGTSRSTDGSLPKSDFGPWLLSIIEAHRHGR